MATMTYTANMANPAVAGHQGVQALFFEFNSGAAAFGTAGDAALLGKLPNGCTVIAGWIRGSSAATAIHGKLLAVDAGNTSATSAVIYGSLTISATSVKYDVYGPIKVSNSADSTMSEALLYLDVTTGASATVSVSLNGVLFYTNDGRDVV